MKKTDFSRRLDSTGRIVIPSRLRQQIGMQENETYDFYTLEKDGKLFLCIECGTVEDELAQAMQIAQKHGMKIVQAD